MGYSFPTGWADLRAVLSHDWLTGMRGGERCLELLCEGLPDAPIFTLVHQPEFICAAINRHPIHTSFIQGLPLVRKRFRNLLPLFPSAVDRFRPPEADLVVSTSHCVAKGIRPPEGAQHVCYCFTPMRYGLFFEDYFGRRPLQKAVARPVLNRLQAWDRSASDRVHRFVAISEHVKTRIRRFYQRDADVVYPPIDTDRCTPGPGGDDGFDLVVSALVPYKRVDLAVRAYTRLGYPLTVVGTGSEEPRLKQAAGPNIRFTGWLSDEEIVDLYRRCRCLVFPGEEDFGIVPLEAQACGKPVVAFARGGALETIQEGMSGSFFNTQEENALLEAVETCAGTAWDPLDIRRNAERFRTQAFIDGLDRVFRTVLDRK
jgi:glycosyltransferase involved in cell wall biosynthesis